jgi:hypothetical protein
MSSPRIGRITFGPEKSAEKSDVLKIADDLAAKSRILRRAAEDHDKVLNRLREIGESVADERHAREKAATDQRMTSILPLMEKAREYIADAEVARKEAKPVLDAVASVDWQAVSEKLSFEHGLTNQSEPSTQSNEDGGVIVTNYGSRFSTDNTKIRIARLQAAANDLRPLVDPASDSELRARLFNAEDVVAHYVPVGETGVNPNPEWKQAWDMKFRYAVNGLRQGLSYGSVAESIRGKLAGIKRLLSEIGEDVLPIENREEAK